MSYPAYVEMKDSGAEWIGDVPSHWEPVRFKFIAAFYGGGTPSKDNASYWKGDIPWVSPKDMKCRVIYDSEDHISEEALKGSATRLIEKGAVLIVVRSGILKHSIPVAINAVPVALNQDMKAVVPGDRIEAPFLAYLIDGCQNALLLEWRKSGATVESLEHDYIANTTLVLPQSDEQRAIVTFLDCKSDEIDTLIKLKERQLELLDKKRQALISHVVTRGLDSSARLRPSGIQWLGDVPAHWKRAQIKRICKSFDYGTSESLSGEGEIRVLTMGNIQNGEIILPEKGSLNNVSDDLILQHNDLLYNRTNSPDLVGKVGIFRGSVEDKISFASYLARMRVDDETSPVFLNYLFNSRELSAFVRSLAFVSINQANLNPTRFGEVVVHLPPLEEQQAIANYLDGETARIDGIAQTVQMQINKLRDYRQSLISAAVTGKIDVRGETDDTVRGVDKKWAGRRG